MVEKIFFVRKNLNRKKNSSKNLVEKISGSKKGLSKFFGRKPILCGKYLVEFGGWPNSDPDSPALCACRGKIVGGGALFRGIPVLVICPTPGAGKMFVRRSCNEQLTCNFSTDELTQNPR